MMYLMLKYYSNTHNWDGHGCCQSQLRPAAGHPNSKIHIVVHTKPKQNISLGVVLRERRCIASET